MAKVENIVKRSIHRNRVNTLADAMLCVVASNNNNVGLVGDYTRDELIDAREILWNIHQSIPAGMDLHFQASDGVEKFDELIANMPIDPEAA